MKISNYVPIHCPICPISVHVPLLKWTLMFCNSLTLSRARNCASVKLNSHQSLRKILLENTKIQFYSSYFTTVI